MVLDPLDAAYGSQTSGGAVQFAGSTVRHVTDALLATDADWLFDEIDAALGASFDVHQVRQGADVAAACEQIEPALVILDLQIGNMGGMAASLSIRQDQFYESVSETPILMLLDRRDDVFLARRAEASGWLVKPIDPIRLRTAVETVLAGEKYAEGWTEPADA